MPDKAIRVNRHDVIAPTTFLGLLGPKKIADKRRALGWLGEPTTASTPTPNWRGWFQHFANGSIYYTRDHGAFEVHGEIRDKWVQLGGAGGFLGFPVTDESGSSDGVGRFNHFDGGSVYWTPEAGAFEVHGPIRERWAALGWEQSFLGYPVSDEHAGVNGTRVSNFQRGQIRWSPRFGVGVSATSYDPQHPGRRRPPGAGDAAGPVAVADPSRGGRIDDLPRLGRAGRPG